MSIVTRQFPSGAASSAHRRNARFGTMDLSGDLPRIALRGV
jgi:hypothetical protein